MMIDFAGVPVGEPPTGFTIAKTGQGAASVWAALSR
jgi:hypothetical protein